MNDLGLAVTRLFPNDLPDEDLPAALDFSNALRRERDPDEPPATLEELRSRLRNKPASVEVVSWFARVPADGRLVARADLVFHHTGQNEHSAHFQIDVLPEWRRRGLGRRLFRVVVVLARERGKSLLMAHSDTRLPAGEAFLRRVGAARGLEGVVSHLDLAGLDRDLLARWQTQPDGGDAFEVGWWDGPYPEDELATITALYNALFADVPQGELQLETPRFTRERLRQMEQSMAANGAVRWVVWARDRATGEYAGLTETVWNPHRAFRIEQHLTGVRPAYRRRGLGRLLKAAMAERVARERPGARYIRTDNADTNAAMLGINREMGFRPVYAEAYWQLPVERAEAYLRGETAG